MKVFLIGLFFGFSNLFFGQVWPGGLSFDFSNSESKTAITDTVVISIIKNSEPPLIFKMKPDGKGHLLIKPLASGKTDTKIECKDYDSKTITGILIGEGKTPMIVIQLNPIKIVKSKKN